MCIYTVSTPLGYYDGCCFYCKSILTSAAAVRKKLGYVSGAKCIGHSSGILPWPIQAELHGSFVMFPWPPVYVSSPWVCILDICFLISFFSLNSECFKCGESQLSFYSSWLAQSSHSVNTSVNEFVKIDWTPHHPYLSVVSIPIVLLAENETFKSLYVKGRNKQEHYTYEE